MTKLRIAPGLALDADYVGGGTFALLAKKGAGKTYTGRVMAEEFWKAKIPFVVLDPMGAWWGLRSSADGNSEGIPVAIFGGEHADAPLERSGGKLMADLVVEQGLSMILDMSTFGSRAAERQFALDFLERLYRTNRDLVHLFIDEADLFAPQKPQSGDQPLLGITENIVRRGRNKGIGITLITQRSAVLNKDVLTQVDGLVAMRMLSPQDRGAIDDWVRDHGDMEIARGIKATLPVLANGACWWWVPELDVLKRVQVRKARTFDSSPTKKRGERRREPASYADIDMNAIEAKMADTIARAKAEDPKELRKRIRELESSQRPEPERVEVSVEVPVVDVALAREVEGALNKFGSLEDQLQRTVADITKGFSAACSRLYAALDAAPAKPARPVPRAPDSRKRADGTRLADATPTRPAPVRSPGPVAQTNGDLQLSKPERAVLNVLGQFPQGRTKVQLAILTGYSIKSSSLDNALGRLRSVGLVSAAGRIPIQITEQGSEYAEGTPLPSGAALLDYWLSQLGKPERAVLMALRDALPDELDKSEIAEITGYSPTSSSLDNALGRLRSLQLVSGFRVAEELL